MLSILTGSFRSLEDELVRRLREREPLEPACVVVPGGQVGRTLKRVLAGDGGVAAVKICSFHALARLLMEDAGIGVKPVVEDFGEEEIFRAFLREPGAPERYRVLAERPGAATLLKTVRDLRAATLTPELLGDVKEELEEDRQRLAELARLMTLYREFLTKAGFVTRAGVSAAAVQAVEGAPLVKATRTWAVYGFYEFLTEQADLLEALQRATEVTVFLPLRAGRAWRYAERTLERLQHLAGAGPGSEIALSGADLMEVHELKTKPPKARGTGLAKLPTVAVAARATTFVTRLFDPAGTTKKGDAKVKVVSASGKADELWYAVKKARDIHESEGVAWRDIAIVARDLEGRLGLAERFFREECVPWTTTASRSLCERPLAQMAALAARIVLDRAWHTDVLEWFSSPLTRPVDGGVPAASERSESSWSEAAKALGIVSGEDWKRLDAARGEALVDVDGRSVAGAATMERFAAAVGGLRAELDEAGRRRGWGAMAEAWGRFLEARLDATADAAAWRKVQEVLDGLGSLEGAAAPPGADGFAAALARALADAKIPVHPAPAEGVFFLDAMAARGRRFRVAFLLGLNEGEWPRVTPEDPYLPDASRQRIALTTGVGLLPKMEGIEEERLLFALTVDAADRVILLHRRVNDDGRKESPSSYLDEVKRIVPIDPATVPRLPVRKFERYQDRLTPAERRLAALLTEAPDDDPAVVKARALDRYGKWTRYDVLEAPPERHLELLREKGFSPTSLERLGTCPFRYWAEKVAQLETLDPLEAEEDATAREVGSVLHAALESDDPTEAAVALFRARAEKRPPLRWAVWEAARDAGLRSLERLVRHDREELKAGGWRVHARELEIGFKAGPGPLPGLHGRIDRVEVRDAKGGPEFRVTDFKYRTQKKPYYDVKSPEKLEERVLREALQGKRLQLLVYAWLVAAEIPAARFFGSSYYFFGPRFDPVRQGLLTKPGRDELAAFAARAWDVAARGRFVIVHDPEVCGRCETRAICRHGHHATRERAIQDEEFRAFREARL